MYCACGAKYDQFTGDRLYSQSITENGRIIYGVCAHGVVVVDNRKDSALTTPHPEASDRERNSLAKVIVARLLGSLEANATYIDAVETTLCLFEVTIRADERQKSDAKCCTWTEESGHDYSGVWNTSCGEAFVYEHATPAENGARFCQHCGNPIEFKPYAPEIDEDEG